MADIIDELQIEISASAVKANDAIDRLINKLDRLTTSLGKIDGASLRSLANGVERLGNAMQTMNTIKTADFTRLATNLTNLSKVDVSALNNAANSMSSLASAFNNLGTVSANAQAVGEMAKNIAKLGNKSVQTAIANIPQLATAMNNLMATLSQSPTVSRDVIDLTNALANLANQGSKVGMASKSVVRGLNNSSNAAVRARKSFGGLAAAFGKFYATYFLVIRGVKGLFNSIKETADYLEAYNYFDVALGKIGKDWSYQFEQYGYENAESYADSFNKRLSESIKKLSGVQIAIGADGKGLLTESGLKNLGLNIKEITQYASQLASVTNSIGLTGEASLAASSAFTRLAGDISSLFNVDYSSVAKNLQSGLIGQSRALYKYGIDITNATLQTYAYNLGIEKSVSEMTQAEKMQLRMLAILDQSKVSWGDLANTINSPSNMLRQFTNNVREVSMILGQLFIPILEKVMPVVNGTTIAIKRLLIGIAQMAGVELDLSSFGQGYTDLEDGLDGITDSLDGVSDSVNKAVKGLRAFDELNIISTTGISKLGMSDSAIDLTDKILEATQGYENIWNEAFASMENKANAFADKIEQALEPINNIFKNFIEGNFFKAGQDVTNLVVGINEFFAEAISSVDWYGIGEKIGDFLSGIDWGKILSSIGKKIWEAINGGIELWKGAFDAAPIETTIVTAIGLIAWSGLGSVIISGMKKALGGELMLNGIKFALSNPVLILASPIALEIGNEVLEEISKKLKEKMPEQLFETLSKVGAGVDIGALVGLAIAGPAGAIAGAIIGAIGGALISAITDYKVNGKSILEHIIDTIFNFDETKLIFEDVKKRFSKGGLNIVLGIGEGIIGALGFIVEPIKDLFNAIWNGICELFGIHSPATKMNPIGENIVLGIKEGFVNAFGKLEEAAKKLWNSFANWFNDLLTFEIEPISLFGKQVFEGATINLGKLPTFSASQKSYSINTKVPNLSSYSSLTKSATNRMQNINTISSDLQKNIGNATYNAVKKALSENPNVTSVNVTLEGDADGVFKLVQSEANSYYKRTQKPAFQY